jgi:hypothetical protein
VFGTVPVQVLYGQERFFHFPATGTAATVGGYHFAFQL